MKTMPRKRSAGEMRLCVLYEDSGEQNSRQISADQLKSGGAEALVADSNKIA